MRRSISYTEPKTALAGETKTWKFIYTPASDLPKGARLKFDLGSKGRNFDWEFPQVNMKSKKNLIWMELPNKKALGAKEVPTPEGALPQFEFTLSGGVKAGEPITIFLGTFVFLLLGYSLFDSFLLWITVCFIYNSISSSTLKFSMINFCLSGVFFPI